LNGTKGTYLGISFSASKIYFTELTTQSDKIALEHLDSADVDFDFEEDLSKYKSNNKALTNLSGEIQKYINKRNTHYSKISLTIGTSQAFMVILPIDYSEGKQSLNSKIYWELSNYFPDNFNDFIVNTYRLNTVMPCGKTDEFLLIAVLKNTLEFVKRIFRLCNLNLSIVDIDHFAAEHNLRMNHPEDFSDKNILLVGLKKGRFDFGLISNRKYLFYTYVKYHSGPEYNLALIRKLNSILNSKLAKIPVENIYLYGDDIREDTLEALKKNNGTKINLVNPFENIVSSSEFLKNEGLRKSMYIYAPGCGVALRSISSKN
jgi:Tfp pilus assembly PilM family ATPase